MRITTALLFMGLGLSLSACDAPKPQVLTAADSSVGINSQGTLTNFPFSGSNTTIIEDSNRGTVCYIVTSAKNSEVTMGCATISRPPQPTADGPIVATGVPTR